MYLRKSHFSYTTYTYVNLKVDRNRVAFHTYYILQLVNISLQLANNHLEMEK